jgi:hypothetical protein
MIKVLRWIIPALFVVCIFTTGYLWGVRSQQPRIEALEWEITVQKCELIVKDQQANEYWGNYWYKEMKKLAMRHRYAGLY